MNCPAQNCPNTSHTTCLGQKTIFNCCEASALREAQGITAPVVFLETTADPPQGEAGSSETEPNELLIPDEGDYEDLLQSEPRKLVNIIRELRSELRRKKNILGYFDTTSQRISQQRDAVVTILDFIDNIAATKSSLDELDTRSIATTAKAEWIDNQWQQHVTTNQTSQAWWTSDKPRPLKYPAKQRRRLVTPAVSLERRATRTLPSPSPER